MPPPNTPEEFFADEYRTAVHNAGRNRSRRYPNLPPHDEDSAESDEAGGVLDLDSHPNTSQSESRRNSIERRMSTGQASSHSRDSQDSLPSRPNVLRGLMGHIALSPSPSTIGPGHPGRSGDEANTSAAAADSRRLNMDMLSADVRSGYTNDVAERGRFPGRPWNTNYSISSSNTEDHTEEGLPSPPSIPWPATGGTGTGEAGRPLEMLRRLRDGDGSGSGSRASGRSGAPQLEIHAPAAPAAPATPVTPVTPAARLERRRPKTPKLDWHALEYIGTYDENLDCPICRAPLVKPQITKCFHIFCAKCLTQSLRHSNRCPIDRNPIPRFSSRNGPVIARPAPHIISNQLDNLHVRCPNRRCDHTSARAFIKDHYKTECPFTKIPCPDPNCDKLVTRRDSEDGRCLHQAIDCEYCGKPVELAALDDHYDADCNQKELMCEHCLAAVPRHRHGTHVMECGERRIECKFRASGCSFTSKKKDFGDHERTCLYGMIMRMNRAHRADMDSMETVLQDSQDRVRKLEAEMAARPAQSPAPGLAATVAVAGTAAPQTEQPPPTTLYEYPSQHPNLQGHVYSQTQPTLEPHQDLSSYYDMAAAGDNLAPANSNNSGGSNVPHPGTPPTDGALVPATAALASDDANSDERMNRIVAYIDIFDAKVENLERYLGEIDARQAQMFMNELGPLKEQILEMRNTMGHISMYVRWLMESFRQTTKRSVGLRGGGAAAGDDGVSSGGPAAVPPSASSAAAGPSTNGAATGPGPGPRGPPTVLRAPTNNTAMPPRRMSDRENPPRL
ncbi:hypothetical protein HMPREF1624_08634 [Sporothrix schenckii ATCC 58251]|uniref:RING-type domain-containing protein n=1 Tax=Sporothrix schenckii (strain ATCC 58251 / de Perez 2211183) TaxID=1391915 RepID=U7PH87_SPOS1|nr:hypothetical protein HMPREF1624_08634 [Sporothrix schenckii ATCC 58251]